MAEYRSWSLEKIEAELEAARKEYETVRVKMKERISDLQAARERAMIRG
jgi:hypothetical protein